jgi:mannose-1-phosphate guanylyltransferase / mannose-6-phosphate isomerase
MSCPTIHPVILCGGAGTRLWPASRRNLPKQFALIVDGYSLFQHAIQLVDDSGFAPPLVVTGGDQRFRVIEQMARIERSPGGVIVEPDARNTAPAVLSAALHLAATDPDALMLVLPSDHRIADSAAFRAAAQAAAPCALAGDIVTFGIEPARPETGYGYLELADPAARLSSLPQRLVRFVEKPNRARAEAMLAGGRHLWNAGIFLMSVRVVARAYQALAPLVYDAVNQAVMSAERDGHFIQLAAQSWCQSPSISIDFAIMEKSANLSVMPFAGGWSDVGDWSSVWREGDPDESGNLIEGEAAAVNCRDSLLRSEVPDQMVVGLDLDAMMVVVTPDAVLVAPQSSSQRVSEVVTQLRQKDRPEADHSRSDHRKWGWYESIAVRKGYQVKQLTVDPHEALSLQSHGHRAEHWIILAGRGRVVVDSETVDVVPGDYVFIPQGAIHQLQNTADLPLLLVEVQTGSYLGEDDIVRYPEHPLRAKAV